MPVMMMMTYFMIFAVFDVSVIAGFVHLFSTAMKT